MRYMLAALVIVTTPALAMNCDNKEYAQYKDRATNTVGRHGLAQDYCQAARYRVMHDKMAALAAQHNQRRDIEVAQRAAAACVAQQDKIVDALTAAGANKALAFVRAGCQGEYSGNE